MGTAQFGLNYGVANHSGQLGVVEARKILKIASKSQIDLIDTAIAYGDSEAILGKIGISDFTVVTKLPEIPVSCCDIGQWMEQQLEFSLRRLGVRSLYGLLLHQPQDLLGPFGKIIIDVLNQFKSEGIVKKIGVSIYDPILLIDLRRLMQIDLVQAPLNVIDRRLEVSGWLKKLHLEGVEVHVRSVFLQGLLLMPRGAMPAKFRAWAPLWESWASALEESSLSAAAVCLAYPLSLAEVDRVIVGVDSVDQLKALVAASRAQVSQHDFSFMEREHQMLINPMNWSWL